VLHVPLLLASLKFKPDIERCPHSGNNPKNKIKLKGDIRNFTKKSLPGANLFCW
jgi:hypothetical protein